MIPSRDHINMASLAPPGPDPPDDPFHQKKLPPGRPDLPAATKQCSKCKRTKPLSEYTKIRGTGLATTCQQCREGNRERLKDIRAGPAKRRSKEAELSSPDRDRPMKAMTPGFMQPTSASAARAQLQLLPANRRQLAPAPLITPAPAQTPRRQSEAL